MAKAKSTKKVASVGSVKGSDSELSTASNVILDEMEADYKLAMELGKDSIKAGCLKVKEIDSEKREVVGVISTDAIDRDKEILLPKGAQLDNFKKNPVIPWSHNTFDPPIGKALWIKRTKTALIAKVRFATTDRAEEVWQLFKQGFLNAFSVGFKPIKGHSPTPDEIKKTPEWAEANWIFDKWELLEFSPVTVPANPEALAIAVKSKSITLSDDLQKDLKIETKAEELEEKEEVIYCSDYDPDDLTEIKAAEDEESKKQADESEKKKADEERERIQGLVDEQAKKDAEEKATAEIKKPEPELVIDMGLKVNASEITPIPLFVNPKPEVSEISLATVVEDVVPLQIKRKPEKHIDVIEPNIHTFEPVSEYHDVEKVTVIQPMVNMSEVVRVAMKRKRGTIFDE